MSRWYNIPKRIIDLIGQLEQFNVHTTPGQARITHTPACFNLTNGFKEDLTMVKQPPEDERMGGKMREWLQGTHHDVCITYSVTHWTVWSLPVCCSGPLSDRWVSCKPTFGKLCMIAVFWELLLRPLRLWSFAVYPKLRLFEDLLLLGC